MTKANKKIILRPGYFIFLLLSFILFTACPEQVDPPEINTTLFLEEDYVGVFETRLYLAAEDSSAELNVSITRNDSVLAELAASGFDTIITDNSVQPGQTYDYQAHWLKGDKILSSSNLVSITTLDTTSHEFIWEMDTLGGPGSYLYDVAVVDENNIWVVGYIKTDEPDTIHNLPYTKYNAAHWDGDSWRNELIVNSDPVKGIHYFSEDDIWKVNGYPIHWDGTDWTLYQLHNYGMQVAVEHLWGTNSCNMYFVGLNGSIVHYNGSTFSKLSSPTDLPFRDIWGVTHPRTGKETVLAVASNLFSGPDEAEIVSIQDGMVITFPKTDVNESLNGVYLPDLYHYFVAGAGVFTYDFNNQSWVEDTNQPLLYKMGIRGTGINNIFVVGAYGHISHFNGSSWKHIDQNEVPSINGGFQSVDVTENVVCAVGYVDSRGYVLIGYRD